jgi:hypothetical protein
MCAIILTVKEVMLWQEALRDSNPEGETKINQPKPQKSSYLHKKEKVLLFCGDRILRPKYLRRIIKGREKQNL